MCLLCSDRDGFPPLSQHSTRTVTEHRADVYILCICLSSHGHIRLFRRCQNNTVLFFADTMWLMSHICILTSTLKEVLKRAADVCSQLNVAEEDVHQAE